MLFSNALDFLVIYSIMLTYNPVVQREAGSFSTSNIWRLRERRAPPSVFRNDVNAVRCHTTTLTCTAVTRLAILHHVAILPSIMPAFLGGGRLL